MKRYLTTFLTSVGILAACSTAQKAEAPVPPPQVPAIAVVPHPRGYDLTDLKQLFLDQRAPVLTVLVGCDGNYQKLIAATQSVDERTAGIAELVKADPVGYHWCFYGKILQLENQLKADDYIDQKQKDVLAAYDFLVPVAHSYLAVFDDSRYLRWAVRHYRRLSDFVFYRRLELTPEMTSHLVDAENPSAAQALSPMDPAESVLAKYKIQPLPFIAAEAPAPATSESRAPAAESEATSPQVKAVEPPAENIAVPVTQLSSGFSAQNPLQIPTAPMQSTSPKP